ncbi:hypothetical protein K0M31_014267 [Melipona bicolor]|uniref:Uncharacterized protein n=1 Tax=Melipona bicolor TaxID=60889 RepID=A0AA40KU69_9HYME|nr:hypothetical protein K0M31_014267 [Melipona bicolor]
MRENEDKRGEKISIRAESINDLASRKNAMAKGMLYGTVRTGIECLLESRGSLVGKQHGTTEFRPVLTINWRSEASPAIHHPESAYLSRISAISLDLWRPPYRTMPRTGCTLPVQEIVAGLLRRTATRFRPLKFLHEAHAILKCTAAARRAAQSTKRLIRNNERPSAVVFKEFQGTTSISGGVYAALDDLGGLSPPPYLVP